MSYLLNATFQITSFPSGNRNCEEFSTGRAHVSLKNSPLKAESLSLVLVLPQSKDRILSLSPCNINNL